MTGQQQEDAAVKLQGYEVADLDLLKVRLEELLQAAGLPQGSVSGLEARLGGCQLHAGHVRLTLRLDTDVSVDVVHCGCEEYLNPTDPGLDTPEKMALDLADEIVAYWRRRHQVFDLMKELTSAFDPIVAKNRIDPADCRLLRVVPSTLETNKSEHYDWVTVHYELLSDAMSMRTWSRSCHAPKDFAKDLASARPYQLALAQRRQELVEMGALGAVDCLAIRAIADAGMDPLKVVSKLFDGGWDYRGDFGSNHLWLTWGMGTLRCAMDLAPGIRWDFGEVVFQPERNPFNKPCSVTRGERLADLVSSPLLTGEELVTYHGRYGDGKLDVKVKPDLRHFGLVDGTIAWI